MRINCPFGIFGLPNECRDKRKFMENFFFFIYFLAWPITLILKILILNDRQHFVINLWIWNAFGGTRGNWSGNLKGFMEIFVNFLAYSCNKVSKNIKLLALIRGQYLTYERSQFKIPEEIQLKIKWRRPIIFPQPNAINQSTFFNIKLAQTTKFINLIFPNIKINELSTIIKSKAYKREKERKRKRKSHHQIISIMFFMFELLQILPS